MTTTGAAAGVPTVFSSQQFRAALGNYPTGVTIVTSMDASGEPLGLTIGSFSSVSLDPPLVAFYPMVTSSTYQRMRESGRFCVNVLADDQESACRKFATRDPNKFDDLGWRPSPLGAPILEGAIAWFDCLTDDEVVSGDHYIVTGRVADFRVERDRMPLLFFQGGYGSFLPGSLIAPSSDPLRSVLQTVDVAREPMERLARDLGTGCLAATVLGGDIITLVSTNRPGSHIAPAAVAQRVRWAPPLGSLFVAWKDHAAQEAWLRKSPTRLTDSQRATYLAGCRRVRERGYTLALDTPAQRAFETAIEEAGDGAGSTATAEIGRLLPRLQGSYEPQALESGRIYNVRHIGAPVFDAAGDVVLDVHLFSLPPGLTLQELDHYTDGVTQLAREITASIGGAAPA